MLHRECVEIVVQCTEKANSGVNNEQSQVYSALGFKLAQRIHTSYEHWHKQSLCAVLVLQSIHSKIVEGLLG